MSTAVPDQPLPSPLDLVVGDRQRREVDTTVPILPAWLRDRVAFLSTAKRFARRNAYRGGKWTLNGPAIVLLLVMYSPRGLARVTVSLSRYLYDWDSAQVRHQHAGNTETPEYVKAQNIRKANLKARWMVASAVTVTTVGPLLAWTAPNVLAWIVAPVLFVWIVKMIPGKEFWEYIIAAGTAALVWWKLPHWLALVPDPPWWLLPSIGAAAVLALGWVGRPKGKDLLKDSRAGLPSELVKPTAEMVVDALIRTGIPGMSLQNADRIHDETRVIAPGVATSSHGYILEMELPPGITTEMVAARRPSFAAALRRDLSMVWPAGLPEKHPGYLRLFLSHQPMNKAKQPAWPIAAGKPIDVFEPIPMFTDEQCRWVNITLAGTHMVMGGASGSGKSVGLRQLGVALAFALNTKIVVFDGKRNGDLEPIRDLCHAYFEGAEPEEIEEQLQCLRWLVAERAKRAKFLSNLPRDIRQPKVTPELAARFPAQLSPIAVLIDECFPAGTLIGDRSIEDLRPGDLVPSWDERTGKPCSRRVVAVMHRRPSSMVRLHFKDGTTLVCTPNHPLMTRSGWTAAGHLNSSSEVLRYAPTRRALHRSVFDLWRRVDGANRETTLLEDSGPLRVLEGVPQELVRATRTHGATGGWKGAAGRAAEGAEPHVGPRNQGEGVGEAPSTGASPVCARRQRAWAVRAAAAARRSVGHWLGYRSGREDRCWAEERRPADTLQVGHCEPGNDGRGRGGWGLTRRRSEAGAGPAEDGVPDWARVDRVEVLEPGSDSRYGGVCPDGLVYNFEVEDTHTYRVGAEGVVAHNCQEHTEYGIKGNRDDKKIRDEFVALYTKLSRLARSVGIMLVFVSQKPDASVLPSAIMGNCGIRVAFRVSEQVHNDQILGTSARKNGIDATTFSLHERGMAWVRGGETADTMVARTWSDMVDLEPAHALAAKAYQLRKQAGLLTGQAAGEDDETAPPKANLLDDVRDVMDNPAGQLQPASRMHLSTIVEALQLVRPGAWDHLDAESLGGMLRKAGVFVGQVKIGNRNTSGIRRQDLDLRVPQEELDEAG